MEGRYPNSIMLTIASCSEVEHIDEWLDWYSRIHTPDITAAGVFTNMIQFINTDPDHQGRQIANLSECSYDDPYMALEELRKKRAPYRNDNRQSPYTKIYGKEGPMIRIGGEFQHTKNAAVNGIFIENVSIDGIKTIREFEYWYHDKRIPSVLSPGIFQSAYRYQALSTEGPLNNFVCIYETDRDDPDTAMQEIKAITLTENSQYPRMRINWEMAAKRLSPMEGRQ